MCIIVLLPKVYLVDDFWSKVDIKGSNDCWLWKLKAGSRGYGKLTLDKKTYAAHRLSYELYYGVKIAIATCVCHTCDVKMCVNPNHLFLGSNRDNQKDKVNKNRQARGSNHGRFKLTTSVIEQILDEYACTDISQTDLAKKHGLSQTHVSRYINGWRPYNG